MHHIGHRLILTQVLETHSLETYLSNAIVITGAAYFPNLVSFNQVVTQTHS